MSTSVNNLDEGTATAFMAEVRKRHGVVPPGLQWFCVPEGHNFSRSDVLVGDSGEPGCPTCQRSVTPVYSWRQVRPLRWMA